MRLISFVLLMFLGVVGYGQKCVVANLKENVVYLGINNPMAVAVEGKPCNSFTLTTDNGEITSGENPCEYNYMPAKPGRVELHVVAKDVKKTVLGRYDYRVKNVPDPVAFVAGKMAGTISRPILEVQVGITASIQGFDFDAHFMVTKFAVTILRGGQMIFTENTIGNLFTPNTIKAFHSLQANDRVLFDEITCEGPDKKSRNINSVDLFIVEKK